MNKSRIEIYSDDRNRSACACRYFPGPFDNQRNTRTSLVWRPLPAVKRIIISHRFGTAIVGIEYNNGILFYSHLLNGTTYLSYSIIQFLNHRSIYRISMVLSYRFILVFINDRCRSLQSRMNRVVREMKKERSIFVGFYKRNSLIRQAVGKVFSRCSFLQSQMAFTFIGQTIRIKIRIRRAGPVSSYIPNESLRKRACSVCVISQMPLSDMPTPVSLLP